MFPPRQTNSPAAAGRPRCTIYVDGFNFYFGVFKTKPEWKWLNLQTFFKGLRPREDVVRINYLTAVVDPKKSHSPRRERQKAYLNALQTLPDIRIVKGIFQPRTRRCEAKCREEYVSPEEKKTDVNIAISMLEDCLNGATDSVVLVSGDSDQEPAIKWIREQFPRIKVTVYIPVLENERGLRRNDFYSKIGVLCYPLPLEGLRAHQFPNAVRIAENPLRVVCRPKEWYRPFRG